MIFKQTLFVFFGFIYLFLICLPEIECSNCYSIKSSCSSCLQQPGCKWCSNPPTEDDPNCVPETEQNKCAHYEELYNTVEASNKTTNKVVQLTPQIVKMKLRRGVVDEFEATFKQQKDFPLDLYFLLDSSNTMEDIIKSISEVGPSLADSLTSLTKEINLGFGTFIDKVILPFTDTHPKLKNKYKGTHPFSFRNDLPLTSKTNIFKNAVLRVNTTSNIDAPEGALEALLQVMACPDEINWRTKGEVRRVVVLVTNAIYHQAGDGKLGGAVIPHDGKCYLNSENEYTHYDIFDYPSVGQINEKAKESKVNVIFTVKGHENAYKKLSEMIAGSSVGKLPDKPQDIVNLVKAEYQKITSAVTLTNSLSSKVRIRYFSNCLDTNAPEKETNTCHNIKVKNEVKFRVQVELIECPSDPYEVIEVNINAGVEVIKLQIEGLCNCGCENKDTKYNNNSLAAKCNNNGVIECGVCSCNDDFYGESCRCKIKSGIINNNNQDDKNCISNTDTGEVCSNKGICECGTCKCDPYILGDLCACNTKPCYDVSGCRDGNCYKVPCSDHGTCNCGKCECYGDYSGKYCECAGDDQCKQHGTDDVCSGHGRCNCGKCDCHSDTNVVYSGKYCEDCPTCNTGRCDLYKDCVECFKFHTGKLKGDLCDQNCTDQVKMMEVLDNLDESVNLGATLCKFSIEETGCFFNYTYRYKGDNQYEIFVQQDPICPPPPNVLGIVAGTIASIVAIGLLTLFIWKVVITVQDQREYRAFQEGTQSSKQIYTSPMFKSPVTETANPICSSK